MTIYPSYQKDIKRAYDRVSSIGSHVIETPTGPIEYISVGDGPTVLVIHGVWGGIDQGLVEANIYPEGFRYIIISRFGYLKTPMPAHPTVDAQADCYASLLDSIGIHNASIVGISAGGPSAVKFALRHRDKCRSLVLVSSRAPESSPPPSRVLSLVLFLLAKTDFFLWAINRFLHPAMLSMIGVPKTLQSSLSRVPEDLQKTNAIVQACFPVRPRSKGILFDIFVSNPDMDNYPIEQISVPALILHAKDDPLSSFEKVRSMAQRIPNARFVPFETGGHVLLGHRREVQVEMREFIPDVL